MEKKNNEATQQEEKGRFLEQKTNKGSPDDRPVKTPGKKRNTRSPPNKLFRKIRRDNTYRPKVIQSMCICWAFVNLGLTAGQGGPSFPDLRLIIGESLSTSSWLFTAGTIGCMSGSFISGILYDRFNRELLLFFSILGFAVFYALMPWCEAFWLMMVIRIIALIFAGALDTGGNSELLHIWHTEGKSYMQALHFAFAFGGLMGPLITEPFLVPKETRKNLDTSTKPPATVTAIDTRENFTLPTNNSATSETESLFSFEATRVQYSYLIVAICILSASFPFLIMFCRQRRKSHEDKIKNANRKASHKKMSSKLKIILLFLLCCMFMTYCCVEDTFASYLMTFCISHLDWTKETGALATALFWGTFSVFRFFGIFMVLISKPFKMIFTFSTSLVMSFVCLFVGAMIDSAVLLWVSIAWAGLSMSVLFPLIFSWTEEDIVPVSSKIAGLFMVSASVGAMVNPLFIGYLMENNSPLWFVYILFGETLLYFIIYLSVFTISRLCSRDRGRSDVEMEVETYKD